MFKFIQNGQNILDNKINWQFTGYSTIYKSEPERLERNVAFFRKKLNINPAVEIILLNVKKVEEHVEPIIAEPRIESIDVIDHSVVAEESSLPQDTKDSVNPPKRKSRAKTPKL